jgi:RNA polymerase sigma-70 factor, ECF subfamily
VSAPWLEEVFERERPRLRAVAFRLLGSPDDAEDAVQEAWLRLSRADSRQVDNLSGWLTTVVARISLDLLRKRGVRAAASLDEVPTADYAADPSLDVELVDAVGSALSIVLDQLSPPERFAFVLHDIFGLQFDELGGMLDRTPNATKQLASRARNKIRGADASSRRDRHEQREVVEAFLAAARGGNFERLIALLHPDVVLDPDAAAIRMGAPSAIRGATAVAKVFERRALAAQVALVDGSIGLAWVVHDRPRVVWNVFVDGHQIVHIDMHADADTMAALGVAVLVPARNRPRN